MEETQPTETKQPVERVRLRPVTEADRIASVDTLRGFALLGILVMNIYAFAMPFAAYFNPLLHGGSTGLDYATWFFTHMLFDQKFVTTFSMLFGAGLVLMTMRAEKRGAKFGAIYYRRMLWLLVIGLVHAYLLWMGDILVPYAICGLFLYPFRRVRPSILIAIGIVLMLVAMPISTGFGYFFGYMRDTAEEAQTLREAGEELTAQQEGMLEAWEDMRADFIPTEVEIRHEIEVYRDGYGGMVAFRAPQVLMMQIFMMLMFGIWRFGGLMLVGMGLLKIGLFSAERSSRFYTICIAVGYGLGLPLVAFSGYDLAAHRFDFVHGMVIGNHWNYVAAVLVALGHIGVVMVVCKSGALAGLRARLAAVGRMALTNYLSHTLILTTVFYGYGLGWFGHVNRFAQMGFVLVVWIFQLWVSPLWLRHFRFGPAEWLWRTLTYWRLQPMRARTGPNES
jgi:uncharacterized protein